MSAPDVASAQGASGPLGSAGLQLLSQLQSAHHQQLACIAVMEDVTALPTPDALQLTSARLKISQSSLARRFLWRRIHEFLSSRVRPADSATLRKLSERDLEQFHRSTAHVSKWTVEASIADWPAYQAASKAMRGHIVSGIKAEQIWLYPLLYRYR